jgi:hypothetical protein
LSAPYGEPAERWGRMPFDMAKSDIWRLATVLIKLICNRIFFLMRFPLGCRQRRGVCTPYPPPLSPYDSFFPSLGQGLASSIRHSISTHNRASPFPCLKTNCVGSARFEWPPGRARALAHKKRGRNVTCAQLHAYFFSVVDSVSGASRAFGSPAFSRFSVFQTNPPALSHGDCVEPTLFLGSRELRYRGERRYCGSSACLIDLPRSTATEGLGYCRNIGGRRPFGGYSRA